MPLALSLFLFILFLIFGLQLEGDQRFWGENGDPYDYWHQSRFSFFKGDMYFPKATPGYYPRPFVVPFLYKIAGGEPEFFYKFQIVLHGLSTLILSVSLISILRQNLSRILIVLLLFLLSCWWNITGWDLLPMSESITTSLFLMWLATLIVYHVHKHRHLFVLHLIATFWFGLSRDHWPAVLFSFYTVYGIFYFFRKQRLKQSLILMIFTLGLFLFQQQSSNAGKRHYLPVMNNIGLRISKSPEQLKWFEKNGMPGADIIRSDYTNLQEDVSLIEFYNDSRLEEFRQWVKNDGKKTFAKFLVTHPKQLLLLNETKDNRKLIFDSNIPITKLIDQRLVPWSDKVFPLFDLNSSLIVILLLAIVYYFDRKRVYLLMIILPVFIFLHAIVSYNADAVELSRHLIMVNIMLQLVGIVSLVLIIDSRAFEQLLRRIFKISSVKRI